MKKVSKKIKDQNGFIGVVEIIVIALVLAAVGYGGWRLYQSKKDDSGQKASPSAEVSKSSTWQTGELVIGGNFADADVVDLGGGQYRMYYSIEPEVPGNQLEMYSATSEDGIKWAQEAGTRKTFATFPSVIKSAVSSDGLSWKDEAGTRVDAVNSLGLNFDNVAAPTVELLSDGTYLMVYRGTINQAYSDQVPNKSTQLFLRAISKDGLSFEKKGLAIDSRNSTLQGLADGPEIVPKWDDGSVKLFFWGYAGVYESTYANNQFSQPKLVYTNQSGNSPKMFPENPPGDPTLIKINDTWNMYYGGHQKGIYRAVLK